MMNAKVLDAMMAKLAPIVHQVIVDAIKPLEARLAAAEARAPLQGEPGKDGLSVTLDDVAPLIEAAIEKAKGDALPGPETMFEDVYVAAGGVSARCTRPGVWHKLT